MVGREGGTASFSFPASEDPLVPVPITLALQKKNDRGDFTR